MIIKCKMCGGDLSFVEGTTVCECEYCGSRQTLPNADSEKKTNLFNRANRLRMNSEFDKAGTIYEQIAAEFPEEAEAYWGLCLCNYGIEYVDDPATGNKMPTCHRTLPNSIMEDGNFEQACDYADAVARKLYRDEAKAIDRIQKDILSIAANEAPYDVFICYKETDGAGDRTADSVLAQEIYDELTSKGLKVFFSRITLEDKLGVQYEPYIYAALSSAKVMLAVGTQFEYYDAVWVKNEWSRFLDMMKTDKRKTLIPCFKDLDAYDMPKEFKGLQAQDMGKLGWLQDLSRGVLKLCGKNETAAQPTVQKSGSVINLMKRVYLFLEDGDFDQATEYIDRVLDEDAEYAPAYAGRVLIRNRLKKENELTALRKSVDDDPDWRKAMRFADAEQRQAYEAYAEAINKNQVDDEEEARQAKLRAEEEARQARLRMEEEALQAKLRAAEEERQIKLREEEKAKKEKYDAAVEFLLQKDYAAAITYLRRITGYQPATDALELCVEEYRNQMAEKIIAAGKENPQLQAAYKNVRSIEQDIAQEQTVIRETENKKKAALWRDRGISADIKHLSNEMNQIHGLFSNSKRRQLESEIDGLKHEQSSIAKRLQEYDAALIQAENALSQASAALTNAKATYANIREENQKTVYAGLSDDTVISAAMAAYEEVFVAEREAKIASFKQIGNYVTFGQYEQDNNINNGKEAIEWLVLDVQGDKALLISKYALDYQRYNKSDTAVTWENCSLRKWLNSTFLSNAFTTKEQKAVLTTIVDNSKSQGYYDTNDGNTTQDKVFLLSYAEAWKYFKNDDARECRPTKYAVAQHAFTYNGNCCWWLRSSGSSSYTAASVDDNGAQYYNIVNFLHDAVRPAFWLDLTSDIF